MRFRVIDEEGEQLREEVVSGKSLEVEEATLDDGPQVTVISDDEIKEYASNLYEETYNSFHAFMEKIFSHAVIAKYGRWVSGEYVKKSAEFLQQNKRTMHVAPRGHQKSFLNYAYIMWKIWKNKKDKKNIRIDYISYNQDLAGSHVGNIKELINKSFFLSEGLYDFDSTATLKAKYAWPDPDSKKEQLPIIEIGAYGIMGGLRGGHPQIAILDDPYADDQKRASGAIEPDIVKKINSIFEKTILPMPLFDGELHIVGTPQSYADLWYTSKYEKVKEEDTLKFVIKVEPAYKNYSWRDKKYMEGVPEEALWPEMFPLSGLHQQEELQGRQQFAQEYLLEPRSSADAFFEVDRIDKSIVFGLEDNLLNYESGLGFKPFKKDDFIGIKFYAAFDPGKAKHPSQFVVFSYENGVLRQILSKWMDSWDYSYTEEGKPSQFKYVADAVNYFGISKVFSDDTNGVLTAAIERNEIPNMIPMKISHSMKNRMAIALQKHLGKPTLRLLPDDRQKRALQAVQNDRLRILEGRDNHGESFTTLGFLVASILEAGKGTEERRITIKTEKNNIPKLYSGFFFERSGIQRKDLSFIQNGGVKGFRRLS
jgi:hypothetical protein